MIPTEIVDTQNGPHVRIKVGRKTSPVSSTFEVINPMVPLVEEPTVDGLCFVGFADEEGIHGYVSIGEGAARDGYVLLEDVPTKFHP